MTVSVLFLVGRFLFAVPFVLAGVDRLLAGAAPPASRAWSALGLVGAAGVVLGVYGDVAAAVLAVAAVAGVLGQEPRQEGELERSIGLVGAALCVAALFVAAGSALDLTITGPVIDLDLR